MSLDSVLSIASSGLYAVQGQISVVAQNVANANTADYTEEVAPAEAVVDGGQGDGVRLGATTRVTSPTLQANLYTQNAAVASQTVLNAALSTVTATEGSTSASTGSTGSLTDLLSTVQAGFTTLQSDPTSSAQQQTVAQQAAALVVGINNLAGVYETQRQGASDAIAASVTSINNSLTEIGSLSSQIVAIRASGGSSAGLEDQRQIAMTSLSGELDVRFASQPNGGIIVTTATGIALPTDSPGGALSYTSNALSPASLYDGTGSPVSNITLSGSTTDVTRSLTGGTLGANIQLRDQILPSYTAQLDSFAASLAQRTASVLAPGQAMFTDATGAVPPSNTAPPIGFSSNIQVAPNLATTLSGLSASVLTSLVDDGFGANSAAGTPWPNATASLTLPYNGSGSLSDLASRLTASQGSDAQAASDNLATATATQTALSTSLSGATSVSVDSEMSKMVALQNSYAANAKVLAAAQSMFTTLLAAFGTG